ncbi:amino acid adenylation domain-containing protein [Streptomyces tendae]|uniref:amino acid adenylation domain-containing protein n=1 Tax=Streptomyces tendae TaxID=1932 RepID=UPI0036781328
MKKDTIGPVEAVLPLTPVQQGMLFHTQLATETDAGGDYHNQVVFRLTGPVDDAALEDAWRKVIARHAVLRAAFATGAETGPVQVIRRSVPFRLRTLDWSAEPDAGRRLQDWLADDRRKGFDLSRPPLLRVALVRMPGGDRRLVWSSHHLLMDGWSVPLILDDLMAAYRGQPLPEQPLSFVDVVEWTRSRDRTAAERYWRTELAGWEPAFGLGDGPTGNTGFEETTVSLSPGATRVLQERVRQTRCTASAWVLAAWSLVLSCCAGTGDVTVGVVTAGRSAPLEGIGTTVGPLVQTVPVRVRTGRGTTVAELVGAVLSGTLQGEEFGHPGLTEIGRWAGRPDGTPLFETVYVYQNYPVPKSLPDPDPGPDSNLGPDPDGGRLRIGEPSFREQTNYPVSLIAAQPADRLTLKIGHHRESVSDARAARLTRMLLTLLEAMAADPECPVDRLPLLEPGNDGGIPSWHLPAPAREAARHGGSLAAVFEETLAARPDAVALCEEGEGQLTYRELDRQAGALAQRLRETGLGPGHTVGVALPRSLRMAVAHLAVQQLGATAVPVDPEGPPERTAWVLTDAGAGAVLTAPGGAASLAGWHGPALTVDPAPADAPLLAEPVRTPVAAAYAVYTSGTTGRPKGVLLPHEGLLRVSLRTDFWDLREQDVTASATSPVFDVFTWELWSALLAGVRVQVVPQDVLLDADRLASLLRRNQVTALFLTTGLFNAMVREIPGTLNGLRMLSFGGEACDPRAVAELLRSGSPERLLNLYGPAECSVFALGHQVEEVAGPVPIGRTVPGTGGHVRDAAGRVVPHGVAGELWLNGPGVAWGYLGRPARTADAFRPNPHAPGGRWYGTGDLVAVDGTGTTGYLGRIDRQVKIRGNRVEPGEVEAALTTHPSVRRCVVEPATDPAGRVTGLVGYVMPERHPAPDAHTLRTHLAAVLPDYMIPHRYVVLDEIPLTASGKTDRNALPAPAADSPPGRPPADDLERRLAAVWGKVLGAEVTSRDDDFFTLGGNSLSAMVLTARIRRELGMTVPLSAVASGPTVAGLARLLRGTGGETPRTPLVRLQAGDEGQVPLFCVHPGGGGVLSYLPLARHIGPGQPVYGIEDLTRNSAPDRDVTDLAAAYTAAVREAWPNGPYLLAGWSFGGMVAYEMAARLRSEGAEVPLMAMIDSGAPETVAGYSEADRCLVLALLATELLERPQRQIPRLHRRLTALEPADRAALVTRMLREQNRLPAGAGPEWIELEVDVFLGRARAAVRYTPSAPTGPVLLLRADSVALEELRGLPTSVATALRDPALGWRPLDRDTGIDVVRIDGDHGTVLLEPHVRGLGKTFRDLIADALNSRPVSRTGDTHD